MATSEQDIDIPPNGNEDEVVIPPDANPTPLDGTQNKIPEEVAEGHVFDPRKHLTEGQLVTLDEFKEMVGKYEMSEKEKAYFLDDMCLLRYLRARDYNKDKSYKV